MTDPYLEVALAEVRGFDLGDDAELLAELRARRDREASTLSGEDWLLLGVLLHRAADRQSPGRTHPGAPVCLERAAELDASPALTQYLRTHMLLRLGRLDQAEAALDGIEAVTTEDDAIPPAEIAHLRGELALARNKPEAALLRFEEGLQLDENSAVRWLDMARTLEGLERFEEAQAAIERAIEIDPDSAGPAYERAAMAGGRGITDVAAKWLARAIEVDEATKTRAENDARFDPVRADEGVAALLAEPPPPNLRWLDELPAWIRKIRLDRTVSALDVQWIDRDESLRMAQDLLAQYEKGPLGTLHTEATLELSRRQLVTMRPVARGPSTKTRDRVAESSLLFVDTRQPDQLWLAPSASYPPFLWISCGTTSESVRRALGELFPRPRLYRLQMPRIERGFMGYRMRFGIPNPLTKDVDPANPEELDRHFSMSPFVESAPWGSAYDDDPWPDEIPAQPGYLLKVGARQRRVSEQARGQPWSMTRRTRHSRSYLSIELHHPDIFVASVRYRPSRHRETIERVNAHFGSGYPVDMPVDAVAALLGFQFDAAKDLQARLDATADPDEIAGLLLVIAALRYGDLAVTRIYRRYMDHPDEVVRSTLCNIFMAHNHESMLEEMSVLEPDDDLRAQIDARLDEGIGTVDYDLLDGYDEEFDFGDELEYDDADIELAFEESEGEDQ